MVGVAEGEEKVAMARGAVARAARAEIDFFDVETAGLFPTLPTRISVMTFPVADLIFAL